MNELFSRIIQSMQDFLPDIPLVKESVLETELRNFLESKGFIVNRQVTKRKDRYDLLCSDGNQLVCLELKIGTNISDIDQFDRYLPKFKDGLIIVCWQASFSLREIVSEVKKQSPIPLEMIELSKRYGFA